MHDVLAPPPARAVPMPSAAPVVVGLFALALVVLVQGGAIEALSAMTERTIDSRFNFGGVGSYLNNVRNALLPLAAPIGGIAVFGVGALFMFGSPQAVQKGGWIIAGIALMLLSPNIIQ